MFQLYLLNSNTVFIRTIQYIKPIYESIGNTGQRHTNQVSCITNFQKFDRENKANIIGGNYRGDTDIKKQFQFPIDMIQEFIIIITSEQRSKLLPMYVVHKIVIEKNLTGKEEHDCLFHAASCDIIFITLI